MGLEQRRRNFKLRLWADSMIVILSMFRNSFCGPNHRLLNLASGPEPPQKYTSHDLLNIHTRRLRTNNGSKLQKLSYLVDHITRASWLMKHAFPRFQFNTIWRICLTLSPPCVRRRKQKSLYTCLLNISKDASNTLYSSSFSLWIY